MDDLKLRKALWLITTNAKPNKAYPYVALDDVRNLIESLRENPDITLNEWTARDIADFVIDVVKDL